MGCTTTRLRPRMRPSEFRKTPPRRVVGIASTGRPYRILVVDDMEINRFLIRELLTPVGFEVAEASNGVEALELFARWSPHAVLMDMRMPLMDGYEATRRIKALPAGRDLPVIAVTASAFEEQEALVMAAGVSVYLRKPFHNEELFAALGDTLGLEYLFAAEEELRPDHAPLSAKSLSLLPPELLRAMRRAVEEGDITRLTELIVQVAKLDSVTALGLRDLAERYDYEKLDQWLEAGEAEHG